MDHDNKSPLERIIRNVKGLPLRRGKNELLLHLEGGRDITRKEAMLAKCYDCMGGYDEPGDCKIPACPLHPWMPFKEGGPRKVAMTDEQREAVIDRLKAAREKKAV